MPTSHLLETILILYTHLRLGRPSVLFSSDRKNILIYFHIRTLHLDIIKFVYSPKNAQVIVLKTILKFTLKYLRPISLQSHPLQDPIISAC